MENDQCGGTGFAGSWHASGKCFPCLANAFDRVPAIYKGTNEPILLDCHSIQLGDQAVYRKTNQAAPELTVCPTKVIRVHVFRDLWELDNAWEDLVSHPVRQLVQAFPSLRLCRNSDCDQSCGFFHPSIEEEGIESGLLDTWASVGTGMMAANSSLEKLRFLSVFIRIPESNFDQLHQASGTKGFFFEPRHPDLPGPDDTYAVVWTPQLSLSEVQHRIRTVDHCITACRLGTKYGVRCLAKHQETLHGILCPNKPYVACAVKFIYRLGAFAGEYSESLACGNIETVWMDRQTPSALQRKPRTGMASWCQCGASTSIH